MPSTLTWRFRAWPPTGTASPRIIPHDDSWVKSSGLRMKLTPDGNCEEASFISAGAGLLVPSLSTVQVQYLNPQGNTWDNLFYGEVRQGGNARDTKGEQYFLRSLLLRLGEVTLPVGFSTPKQAAHLTVRAIIQAAIASGQLGTPSLVTYDALLCPDLGFDCRPITDANGQDPLSLLEQIRQDGAGFGVTVALGVNPDGAFFCTPARTFSVEVFDQDLVHPPTWQPPNAEKVYTAVEWYAGRRQNGKWFTYLSVAPEAGQYGLRVTRETAPNHPDLWLPAQGSHGFWTSPDGLAWTYASPQPAYDATLLRDGLAGPTDPALSQNLPSKFGELRFISTGRIDRVRWGGALFSVGASVSSVPSRVVGLPTSGPDMRLGDAGAGYAAAVLYRPDGADFRTVGLRNASALGDATAMSFTVEEFHPERLNTELLDQLARNFYRFPAQEPADIETRPYRSPDELGGRLVYGTYNRAVEAWEYRLTAGRGLTLAAMTGQADDPRALAQAELIKARDRDSVIQALTAPT